MKNPVQATFEQYLEQTGQSIERCSPCEQAALKQGYDEYLEHGGFTARNSAIIANVIQHTGHNVYAALGVDSHILKMGGYEIPTPIQKTVIPPNAWDVKDWDVGTSIDTAGDFEGK